MPYLLIFEDTIQAKYQSAPTLPPGAQAEEVTQAVFDAVREGWVRDGFGGFREIRWYDDEELFPTAELLKPFLKNVWKKDQSGALMVPFKQAFPQDVIDGFAQSRQAADAYIAHAADASKPITAAQTARIENEASRRNKTGIVVANDIVVQNDKYLKALGELNGFRGNIDQIVDGFAKGVGESEAAAKTRLFGIVEAERASTASDLSIIFGGA